jgi:hypothetical protein
LMNLARVTGQQPDEFAARFRYLVTDEEARRAA